jgi:nitrate reductase NapA
MWASRSTGRTGSRSRCCAKRRAGTDFVGGGHRDHLAEDHGRAGQFAIYGSGQWTIPEGYAANKFMKGGLSQQPHRPECPPLHGQRGHGLPQRYGVDEPAGCYDDLDKCDVLIMWGNNMAEMHPVLFSRVMDRRTRGEKVTLIDIGTRRTRTSEFCDHYLEFRPHSDLAIMNGIAHLLIKNERLRREVRGALL